MRPTSQAVFLIGGLGTRLGSLTTSTPKPLLPVAGRPFIEYLVENFHRFGIRNVVLLAGYLSHEVMAWQEAWSNPGIDLSVVIEPEAAGTAGALLHARDRLDDQFFLANGDSFFDFNLLALGTLDTPPDWVGKLALRPMPINERYGRVELDASHRVVAFKAASRDGSGPINGGVYLLRRSILDRINRTPMSIEGDVFPPLAQQGLLYGLSFDGFFLDIGIPDDFGRAQTLIPACLRRPAAFIDLGCLVASNHGWVDGARDAIKALNDGGFYVFVVAAPASGANDQTAPFDFTKLQSWMRTELAEVAAHVDGFESQPFRAGGPAAQRRQAPGGIGDGAPSLQIDQSRSFLISSHANQIQSAGAVGIEGHLLSGGDIRGYVSAMLASGVADHRASEDV